MLLRYFKGNNPGAIVLIIAIAIAVWAGAFLHPSGAIAGRFEDSPMPLFGLLLKLTGSNLLVRSAVAFIFGIGIIFLLMHFNTTNFFINERTYLPVLIYSLGVGYFPAFQSLNPVQPAAAFLMLAIIRIIDSYRKPGLASNFFDAALLISIGSLFYASLIWFGILIIIGIILIRTVNLSEIAIALIGFVTPYFILFGTYYVLNLDIMNLRDLITANLFGRIEGYHLTRLVIAALVVGVLATVISLGYLITHMGGKKVKSRQTFSLLIWAFLLAVAVFYILPSVSMEMIWIIAIPVSYFITHYFVFIKKRILPDIVLSLLLLSVFLVQFFFYK